ncbi:hypothetical protein BJ912DRAFT_940253 [Pholiota molesta]|nr:hypothetical protein BJ912DRAFT_940253 [Pholiota molesta]
MPKVVSRSAVSSSTDAQPTASSAAALRLVIDKSLATLPRRKTDNAIIVRSKESAAGKPRVFKLNAVAEEPILLERLGGHEKQYRYHCPRYITTPVKSAPFLYIFSGALTQMQGQVPQDAFDGENDL